MSRIERARGCAYLTNSGFYILFVLLAPVLLAACGQDYVPKPKGYNRIDLPAHAYVQLPDSFPYQFQYSRHADIVFDSSWMEEPYWIDIHYPEFVATIQITYKQLNNDTARLQELLNDSYKLTAKHQIKAYAK